MIFDNNNAAFRFMSAVYISDRAFKRRMAARTYCALSYRIDSATQIISHNANLTIQGGDITFFPSNTPYSRISEKDELIAVHFETFDDFTDKICVFTPQNSEKYLTLFKEILHIYKGGKPGYEYEACSVLNKIFMNIYADRSPLLHKHSEKFITAKKFMNKNYSNPQLTSADIAKACSISEGYLRKIFANESGLSPKRYLNKIRVQRAVSLINSGFYTIAEVSEMVGFYDPKYFSTVYKKYAASSPKSYIADNHF